MTPIAPTRTLDQRLAALDYANQIRVQRADLKRDLRDQPWAAVAAIEDPPAWLHTMKVSDLLAAIPRIGDMRIRIWLDRTRVSHAKTLGGLTQRQRDALTDLVRRHVDRITPA